MRNNKDKTPIDESILDETPPNINEPQPKEDLPESTEPAPDKTEPVETETPDSTKVAETKEDHPTDDKEDTKEPVETDDQKEQRYKAQQTEAQIQAAKNKAISDKFDQASQIGQPTVLELTAFVAQDGVNWDDLTAFEQATAKRAYIAEKRFSLVNESIQAANKIDEWSTTVDTFIDSTENKPEYIGLSGYEMDFRKFCMKDSHRGADVSMLLSAFLYNLPLKDKKRGNLFEHGGGGEKDTANGKISDADAAAALRQSNPREYARQVKAGKISIEV